MPFGLQVEWYGNLTETEQVFTALATLLGALVLVAVLLVGFARRTPALLAVALATAVLAFGYNLTIQALPDVDWAQSLLRIFLFGCSVIFGMQWQKKR